MQRGQQLGLVRFHSLGQLGCYGGWGEEPQTVTLRFQLDSELGQVGQ
jgi:hypothetical protein